MVRYGPTAVAYKLIAALTEAPQLARIIAPLKIWSGALVETCKYVDRVGL